MTGNTFKLIKSPGEFKQEFPLTPGDHEFIAKSRNQICQILCGIDPRLIVIMGPCSIHDERSALEYAHLVRELQNKVKDNVLLVMRFYFEKPRSKVGWKGLLYDPYINGADDLEEGIHVCRKLMTEITEIGVPIASEIVDPMGFYFFNDLISWLCIGARTSSSQVHRQNASALSMPVGFKNDLSGNIGNAVDSIIATDTSHTFLGIGDEGRIGVYKSTGAPFAHIVLRGAKGKPNYYPENIKEVEEHLEKAGLMHSIVVDCSHDNCNKNYEKMPEVFEECVRQIKNGSIIIRGLMLESHILPGTQPMVYDIEKLNPQISITDPCIGWHKTEELIDWAHHELDMMIHAGV